MRVLGGAESIAQFCRLGLSPVERFLCHFFALKLADELADPRIEGPPLVSMRPDLFRDLPLLRGAEFGFDVPLRRRPCWRRRWVYWDDVGFFLARRVRMAFRRLAIRARA